MKKIRAKKKYSIPTHEKLEKRCAALTQLIIKISEVYSDTTDDQKNLIETMIGAALWYLPHGDKYWTGNISKSALRELRNNKKVRLTKEHQHPRKFAAKQLLTSNLNDLKTDGSYLLKEYESTYAKFNLVTPKENKAVVKHQNVNVFKNPKIAYNNAGIELIPVSKEELRKIKRGEIELIDKYLEA